VKEGRGLSSPFLLLPKNPFTGFGGVQCGHKGHKEREVKGDEITY